jgi:hypothetical protein
MTIELVDAAFRAQLYPKMGAVCSSDTLLSTCTALQPRTPKIKNEIYKKTVILRESSM